MLQVKRDTVTFVTLDFKLLLQQSLFTSKAFSYK